MKIKNIFNGMGYAGQLGQLGTIIKDLMERIEQIETNPHYLNLENISAQLLGARDKIDEIEDYLFETQPLLRCIVSFDSDGGSNVEAQTTSYGTKAEEPDDPVKEGYVFGGWYLGEESYNFNDYVKADITLKARWSEA